MPHSVGHLSIGDAVVPRIEPDHDVMTVYDFDGHFALCNWVVGTRMFKVRHPVDDLMKLRRIARTNGR